MPSEIFSAGTRLHHDRYEVLSPLGTGGFSQTFEVDDRGTIKVLKVLSEDYPKAVDLFQREFKVLSQLRHPGVPLVEADGYFTTPSDNPAQPIHCLIMERIPGVDLRKWLRERDGVPIDQETALDWLTQLTEILAQLHEHHCFHRDIKPSNIMQRPNGQLVLIDFGAVREVTETFLHKQKDDVTRTHLYSRGYTPMEQMQGRAVPQSDFFALGRTFVHLLTGHNPLDFSTDFETGALLWREQCPDISVAFADLIDRLMALVPGQRPADPDMLFAEIATVKTRIALGDADRVGNVLETDRPSSMIDVATDVATKIPPEWLESPSDEANDSGGSSTNPFRILSDAQDEHQAIDANRVEPTLESAVDPGGGPLPQTPSSSNVAPPTQIWPQVLGVAVCSLVATTGLMGLRLTGILQGVELLAFDQLMRWRSPEPLDDRIVLITNDEEDINYQKSQGLPLDGSLSDQALAQLLAKIQPYQPQVIGLDIYREPTASGNLLPEVVASREALKQYDNLVAVCEIGGGQQELHSIAPPAELPLDQVGFSNIPYDPDGRVRRQLVGSSPDQKNCNTSQSLSIQLAVRYLSAKNFDAQLDPNGTLFIGDRAFPELSGRIGGYQHPSVTQDGGYQLLLNYRANPNLAAEYGLADILRGDLDDRLADIVMDRIVLVGTTGSTYKDYHDTPYGSLSGVVIHAHMVSQLIAAVLDDRPLIWGFPLWGDALWVFAWAGSVGWVLGGGRSPWLKIGAILVLGLSLTGTSFILLGLGGWMPLVPPLLATLLTALCLKFWPRLFAAFAKRLQS